MTTSLAYLAVASLISCTTEEFANETTQESESEPESYIPLLPEERSVTLLPGQLPPAELINELQDLFVKDRRREVIKRYPLQFLTWGNLVLAPNPANPNAIQAMRSQGDTMAELVLPLEEGDTVTSLHLDNYGSGVLGDGFQIELWYGESPGTAVLKTTGGRLGIPRSWGTAKFENFTPFRVSGFATMRVKLTIFGPDQYIAYVGLGTRR